MLKAEYHERVEQAMWRRARDKRVPAWWRLHLRFQANRFRILARRAKKNQADSEPTAEQIGHIARQLRCSVADARKIITGGERSS
jgi:hypothetical protein